MCEKAFSEVRRVTRTNFPTRPEYLYSVLCSVGFAVDLKINLASDSIHLSLSFVVHWTNRGRRHFNRLDSRQIPSLQLLQLNGFKLNFCISGFVLNANFYADDREKFRDLKLVQNMRMKGHECR